MSDGSPVLERIRADGPSAAVDDPGDGPVTSPDRAGVCLDEAAALPVDDPRVLDLWREGGGFGSFEELDALLERAVPGGFFRGFSGRRKRLRNQARRVVRESSSVRAVRLAVAVLGAAGDRTDAPALEDLSVHPHLTHYGATALANLAQVNRAAKESLLKLLKRTGSAERVIVIDRLLWFVREPIVRLALIRDALRGMEPEDARQVADDIYHACNVEQGLNDPASSEALREGARLVLVHRTEEA